MKKNQNSVFKIEPAHQDLTNEITLLCLKRYLKRIKSQIKYTENFEPQQIKGLLNEFKIIKKAINVVEFYN